MSKLKYTVYQGKFACQICKQEVGSLRLYPETQELTWMCKDGHMSNVSLNSRRRRKDFE
jgi:hypothetical protein